MYKIQLIGHLFGNKKIWSIWAKLAKNGQSLENVSQPKGLSYENLLRTSRKKRCRKVSKVVW